ncbi:MAG: S41 family peptidase [Pseudomonadota bacterium]
MIHALRPISIALVTLLLANKVFAVEQYSSPLESEERPPLFAIGLEQPFPDPESTFKEVKELLQSYYYSNQIDDEILYRAAIQGMLRHVSPPESPELARLWAPAEFSSFEGDLRGLKNTLGMQVKFQAEDGSLTVVSVAPNSPAAGKLQPHDRIMRINQKPLRGLSSEAVAELLAGEEDTRVELTVVRDVDIFEVPLQRAAYEVQNLAIERRGKLAYVVIRHMSQGIAEAFAERVRALQEDGVDRLIIDLRNNIGGDFYEGLKLAEVMLPKGAQLLYTLQNEDTVEHYRSENPDPIELDAIVLINENTASAAEVFAAALRDHDAARLVGTRSHGKATAEGSYKLDNGHYIKFIIAAMYSPRGQSWQSNGLLPDYFAESRSGQLDALQALALKQQLPRDLPLATAWKLFREAGN